MLPLRYVLLLVLIGVTAAAWIVLPRAPKPQETARPEPLDPGGPTVVERRPVDSLPNASPVREHAAPVRSPWTAVNEEATLCLSQGDLEGAVERFARCHAAEPAHPVFAGNLAEALIRLARSEHDAGEIEDAVEHLARAVELAPERADAAILSQMLERWRRELELGRDDWTEGSSRFELSFDTDRADILHHSHEVLEHLEESYEDLRRWFGAEPSSAPGSADAPPIRVVLYDSGDFDRLTGLGDWAGGLFDGVVRVSVDDLSAGNEWKFVLVHELVHAFVQGLSGSRVPGWLNEGLAQLLENRGGLVERCREQLRGAELFPLEQLAGSLASWKDRALIARAYAQSLVFVAHVHEHFGDEALRRMVLADSRGQTLEESFRSWTGVPLDVVFHDWQDELAR